MPRLTLPKIALVALLWGLLLALPTVARAVVPVTFKAVVTPVAARPGETVTVAVTATLNPAYHIYSIVPVNEGPQETILTVNAPGLTAQGGVTETAPVQKNDANFGKVVGLHEGAATFTQHLLVGKDAKPATLPLAVTVRYGACNATSCLPPKTVTVETPALTIEAGDTRAAYVGVPQASVAPGGGAPAAATASPAPVSDGGGLGTFILQAFAAGLLALITPCVFPMIPVTLAFFTKQAAGGKGGIVRLAGVYSLGIVGAFTTIGAVLAAVFGASSAQNLAANPWLNLVFAGLFIVFGLAMMEVFELRLPSRLQGLAGGGGANRGGTWGVLGMGLTFVIAAFTCTAPFLGTVLVAASSASSGAQWVRPIVGMVAFSTALALPFFLLALFPGLLARMPRSGAWLGTVKGAMGFVEIAAALKFLSNTDLVWQWKILTQPVLLALWTVIALSAAAWLLGGLKIGWGSPEGKPTPARTAWAALFAATAAVCLWGLTGRPLPPALVAYLPSAEYGAGEGKAAEKLPYLDTLEAGIAQAKLENKPIFVDFTGYTCTNCRYIEKNVFPKPEVEGELDKFVRVRLYTDGGPNGDKNQQYQEKTFGDVALPLYAVLSPDGTPRGHVAYTVAQDPAQFAAFLKAKRDNQAFVASK